MAQTVLITGCSSGIGRAAAEHLAARGYEVYATARSAESIADLAAEGCKTLALDVTDDASARAAVEQVEREAGGIDVLVNNAGGARPGPFQKLADEDWKQDLDVKLFSMIRFTRAVLPSMRARGGGRIVNINAVLGRSPDPALFATSVNRAACISLSKTLAIELGPENILVNSVNIGSVLTPNWENIRLRRAPDVPAEEFFAKAAERIPLRRLGRPDEVAGIVAFLAGDRGSYITGASIDVAGGAGGHI
jgi:3-oxoacyl-[acyl-carrier protein] reductase